MQTIYPTSLTPEQYVEQEYHKQVRPPENCPNCQRAHALEALAYYDRYITTATALVLMIWVRRFLCRLCRVSVSCLPTFAQPYRPVNTPTIAAGFNGEEARPEVQRWSDLIDGYWRGLRPIYRRCCGRWATPSVRCRSGPRPKGSGANCYVSAAIWPVRRDNSSTSSTPAYSELTAATSAGSFRLHKGCPRRSRLPVDPHTPF